MTRTAPSEILARTDHRPWPVPDRGWIQRQTWNDFVFCHWPVPVHVIRQCVPRPLELDLWDGGAWLGIIPFNMTGVTLRGFPDLPWFSAFPELNVRTYVRLGDRRGVYFLSLEAHNPLAVTLARVWFGLPYMRARMRWGWDGDAIEYRSIRTHRGEPPAAYDARITPEGEIRYAVPGTFEHWLTERYALFVVDRRHRIWQGDVHHTPWPIRSAFLEIRTNTLAASHGIVLPDTAPHVLYSPKVDTVVWSPRRVTP